MPLVCPTGGILPGHAGCDTGVFPRHPNGLLDSESSDVLRSKTQSRS
jgi:hypothetical protein